MPLSACQPADDCLHRRAACGASAARACWAAFAATLAAGGISIECKRAGLEISRATVDAHNRACACGTRAHERQRCRDGAAAEESLAGAEDHRERQQPVLIDEVVLDQRLGESATTV